jgi:predicted permease
MTATILQDLRFALRSMRRRPGFTLIVALTLALGIGSTTAIFSVVDGVLLRPLPYRDPDRLAFSWTKLAWIGVPRAWMNGSHVLQLREETSHFEALVPMQMVTRQLIGTGTPEQVLVGVTGTSLFDVLGVPAAHGRVFRPDEGQPGRADVAVLGHVAWLQYFGADPGVVGRTIEISGSTVRVIGVMPPHFRFRIHSSLGQPGEPDLWMPGTWKLREMREGYSLAMLARVKPGVSMTQAQAELDTIGARFDREHFRSRGFGWQLTPVHDDLVKQVRPALIALISAAALLMLIACANVANLVLVRTAAREREFAIRAALGGGSWRLLGQVLTENLALSAAGGALGLAVASVTVRAFIAWQALAIPRLYAVAVDGRVLLFTTAITLVTGMAFGLLPALRSTRRDLTEPLRTGARGLDGSSRQRGRSVFVVAEVALAIVLLLGAALLLRTFAAIRGADPGFSADGVLTARITLSPIRYPQGKGATAFIRTVLDDVAHLPGVEAAAATNAMPLSRTTNQLQAVPEGAPDDASILVDAIRITPGYFRSLRITLLGGREFTWDDAPEQEMVAVVDEVYAATAWPKQNPIGKHFKMNNQQRTVVGVVRQPRLYDVHRNDRPQVFMPMAQNVATGVTLVVRAHQPRGLIAPMRQAIWARDAGQPVANVRLLTDVVGESLAVRRLSMLLLGGFAAAALLLAALGIYGVIASAVGERTQEIGVRMALGATARDVVSMVVGRGLRLVTIGLAIGLAGAVFFARLIQTQLYGVSPTDPATFTGAALLLIVVAMIAAWLPARRAARIDPSLALRAN